MKNDRLNLEVKERLLTVTGVSATLGLFSGVLQGARISSLRYLAMNAHRLPKTRGGWYFFHKRKNNVLLFDGINQGIKTSLKFGSATLSFFGLEALLDELWGTMFLSTGVSAFVLGSGVAWWQHLPFKQGIRSVRNFTLAGLVAGVVQDFARHNRRDRA